MPAGLVVIRHSLDDLEIDPVIELCKLAFDDFECFKFTHIFTLVLFGYLLMDIV